MKTIRRFITAKLLSLCLIGTAAGQLVVKTPAWDWTKAPTEARVKAFARAIGRTEGFFVKKSIPNRLHNPGDIRTTLRHAYPGQVGIYRGYAVFKNDKAGWAALEAQIWLVINGQSKKYRQEMSMYAVARTYAEDWRYWGKSVCKILKVSPKLTLQEFFDLAPRVVTENKSYDRIPVWTYREPPMPILSSMPLVFASVY